MGNHTERQVFVGFWTLVLYKLFNALEELGGWLVGWFVLVLFACFLKKQCFKLVV